MYLAAYYPILGDMKKLIDTAYSKKRSLSKEQNERLVRLIDHHNYTMHTVNSMVLAGRLLTRKADKNDRKYYVESKSKRDSAKARIKKYRAHYISLIDEMDANSHTGVLYGKKPTIVVRAPSDFNQ